MAALEHVSIEGPFIAYQIFFFRSPCPHETAPREQEPSLSQFLIWRAFNTLAE